MYLLINALPWQSIVHYGCHFVVPLLLALCWGQKRWRKAYVLMLATMLVDLDHLLATPVFDPHRMSIGFHPLHSYVAIAIYAVLCLLPYGRLGWPWWWRAIGVGLLFHMATDWQDYVLWH